MGPRCGHSRWTVLAFLVGAVALLLLVIYQYLLPAMRASKDLDSTGRKHLAAVSVLVLAIVLVMLLAGLILTIRPGRYFLPRKSEPRAKTTYYVDAWTEAGSRMQVPPKDEEE
jgi:multisubunit Na+/H+ antiporter MnhB subunit